jgi:hypothetical protein
MPRDPNRSLDPVYAAAQQFANVALRADSSIFTPGRDVWTVANVEEFHRRFVDNADHSSESFNTKLLGQLNGATAEVDQLAAELLFFHSLGISNQGPLSKRVMIDPLLERAGVEFPDELAPALLR